MRKTVMALMIVLPLLFILIIFTAGTAAGLNTTISANGIEILGKPEDGILAFDYAQYNDDYEIFADVKPTSASDRNYKFVCEEVEDSDQADVEVIDNKIVIRSLGKARLTAISNDGGYRDSVNVIVGSSKPVDFGFSLKPFEGGDEVVSETDGNFYGETDSGKYRYSALITPSGFSGAELDVVEGTAVIDEAAGSVLLPFSGHAVIKITLPDGAKGEIVKELRLDVKKRETAAGFTIDGSYGTDVNLRTGSTSATVYVETDGEAPTFSGADLESYDVSEISSGKFRAELKFTHGGAENEKFDVSVTVGANSDVISYEFKEFDFAIRADLPNEEGDIKILTGRDFTFFAYALVNATDITYRWSASGGASYEQNSDGSRCVISAENPGIYSVTVYAIENGQDIVTRKTITIEAIAEITDLQITNDFELGLAKRTVVAGRKYVGNTLTSNAFEISLATYRVDKQDPDGWGNVDVVSSDDKIASAKMEDGKIKLEPKGTGDVRITAFWRGNSAFGMNVRTSVTLTVANNAVAVESSEELLKATGSGFPVVLTKDIMLGTDKDGQVLTLEERKALVKTTKSTYNTQFYKNSGTESAAVIKYIVEFSNDVYGNGHFINAEYIANAMDGTLTPQIFMGPLNFVEYMNGAVAVAGQDNASFIVKNNRKADKTPINLYNVTLMGCSDESLIKEGEDGNSISGLELLNNVGTVLDVNCSVKLINCRIRNGRTAVRAYGGNGGGNAYFVNNLSNKDVSDERIYVDIEGCIISQAREFLVKIGTNRALKATENNVEENSYEPYLKDAAGNNLPTNIAYDDEYFYSRYVLTDVTLKDSVLEKCGLFSVGMESNFSGGLLYDDEKVALLPTWKGTGGTSFASVLRLEGDVKIYDWKQLDLVDSSTLIIFDEKNLGLGQTLSEIVSGLKLDIKAMLEYVCSTDETKYGDIIELVEEEGQNGAETRKYVHGGIAVYGGGRNYSKVVAEGVGDNWEPMNVYSVNISVLEGSPDKNMQNQGKYLPLAAGTQDFRFHMYGKNSANNYEKQKADSAAGIKYDSVKPKNLFGN